MNNNYTNIYGKNNKKGIKTDFDLSGIELVKVRGKEYIKCVDPDTQETILMENLSKDNLELQFKKIIDENHIKMRSNSKENTDNIIRFMKKSKLVSTFIRIKDMENNLEEFNRQLDSLNEEKLKLVKYFITHSEELKIDRINIENAIAVDRDNNVIDAYVDINGKINAGIAEKTENIYNSNSSFAPSSNTVINKERQEYTDEDYMNFPELLERQYQKGIIDADKKAAIEQRIAIMKQKKKQNNYQKQYVYTNNADRKAGFLDTALFPGIIIFLGIIIVISLIIIGTM